MEHLREFFLKIISISISKCVSAGVCACHSTHSVLVDPLLSLCGSRDGTEIVGPSGTPLYLLSHLTSLFSFLNIICCLIELLTDNSEFCTIHSDMVGTCQGTG